ncbi:chemotaxis protein histidine kinase CheA [Azospirillum agricola]|uniref:ATP-binding protein n=1 Tax=Azospirillum agricola TaxID=1720247 RepID=UPI001AE29EC2|nr:ATP-binding protein [Azospirillum agricola]MBP2227581.1 chemotaxis protein histidine kinase CheA [Azospirillum agricola]
MSELIETLWRQFGVEAGEHLDAIEALLAAPPGGTDGPQRIAALFRAFHSLKGAARAMDLFAMEAVAHRAETILGRIRAGSLELTGATADPLLEALDALRGLVEQATRDRRDGVAPDGLLAKLDALGGGKGAGKATADPSKPPNRLHGNDKLLGLFVGLLHDGMATLTRGLDPAALDGEELRAVDDTAERLEIACERLDFLPFADTLRGFRAALAHRDADAALRALQAVAVASARVGRLSGRDAGAAILVTLLADHNAQALESSAARALELMADPRLAEPAVGVATGAELAGALDRVAATLDIVTLPRAAALVRVLADVTRHAAPFGQAGWPGLLADSRMVVERLAALAMLDPPEDLDDGTAAELERRLRACVDGASAGARSGDADAGRPFTAAELTDLGLDAGLLRFLSPDSAADLRAAVADPAIGLCEVTAFLETSAEVASGFVAWLGSRVQAITNWPEFIDGKTWLKLLVASPLGLDELRGGLSAIDPGGELLRIRRCVPGGAVTDDPSAAMREPDSALPSPVPPQRRPADPSAPPAAVAPAQRARQPAVSAGVLRVPGEVVDRFMARIDGMVLLSGDLNAAARDTGLEQAFAALADRLGAGDPGLRAAQEAMERHRRDLLDLDARLSRSVDRLREAALDLRVVPVETLFTPFPRMVRELARAQGKSVRFATDGGDVRIDKSMVETLHDPLMHMVRNAIDHGIELPAEREAAGKPPQATLSLRAVQRNSRVVVEIADDGRGIATGAVRAKAVRNGLVGEEESRALPPEAIHDFIFAPGFSTAEAVTETSGRGVGMDVVRTAIARLGGSVAIRTAEGEGTAFAIDLPLSAAILRALLVEVGDQVLAIPDRFVEEVCGLAGAAFDREINGWAVRHRDRALPVVRLADALDLPTGGAWPPDGAKGDEGQGMVVVLRHGDRCIGLAIDALLRRGDLFVRESHPGLAEVPGVGGVSLLNDGRIVIILDGDALYRLATAAQARRAEGATGGS